ncbi:MAG: MmcQ/YjbR family DNA-binding protein [Nonomuraea sp.]|nr:MmcQ/YjbR family DNA-binding protein [Nonomuraea sp.]
MPDQDLLAELAADFGEEVVFGTMFRSPGLRVGGKIFAFLGSGGVLIVKLPRERALALVSSGGAAMVTMGKRTMREWVSVPAGEDEEETLAAWRGLVHEAHDYVDALRGNG